MPYPDPIVIQDDLSLTGAHDQDDQVAFSEVILSRLNIVSQCLANAEAATSSVTSSTISEFEDIFACLSLGLPDSPTPTPSTVVSPEKWLLDNLHNPYPPSAVKRVMVESSELGGRTVNEWFTRARQRIGWTRLLRDRFDGCRSAATDAAFRAFIRDDPSSPLDVELYAAFMAVKAHANHVYTPVSPSVLDTTPHPCPPSRSSSAAPSLTHSTDSEDSDCDASQTLRKRKRSCSELPPDSHPVSYPLRKRRLQLLPKQTSFSLSQSSTSARNCSTSSPNHPRKRRLSEANSEEPAVKKLRSLDWAPRKQTVSDPLPLPTPSFDWESWCTEAFVLPSSTAASHQVPDALDFELFNFEAFPNSQPIDAAGPLVDALPGFHEQPDVQIDTLFVDPSKIEKGPWPAPWDDFFNFELPRQTSSLPSLTNSPSSSESLWSLSPPQLASLDPLGSAFFDFSSPSLFKIPTLYPTDTDGVEIVGSGNSFIL